MQRYAHKRVITNTCAYSNIHYCTATHCSRAWSFVATRCFSCYSLLVRLAQQLLALMIASPRCHSSGWRLRVRVPQLLAPATKPLHKPTAMPPQAMRPTCRIRLWACLRLRSCRCERAALSVASSPAESSTPPRRPPASSSKKPRRYDWKARRASRRKHRFFSCFSFGPRVAASSTP